MKSFAAKIAVAAFVAFSGAVIQSASAAPLGAGLTAAPAAAETQELVTPVQWGPGYGYGYERRRVYRDDDRGYRRGSGRGYGNAYGRGYGNAYGRRDRYEGRRSFDSGYRGRPGVVFGPGGRGGERCFVDGAGRKVCR